ncbi:MAG: O-antigen ligase family protein [Nanoarchaeota archaeon]|nr:O-antigen ligase family protein [Nanoarchaeota archaeon]
MRFLAITLILGTAIIPLVAWNTIAGATAGKIFLFRVFIEGAMLIYALQVVRGKGVVRKNQAQRVLKHPITLLLGALLLSMVLSAVFSVNPYRAFWGTIERGEGVFGVAHYIILFLFVAGFLTRKERLTLLKIFCISGYILILYGVVGQYGLDRVRSYIGNAAFFAGHLLFLIAVAWIVINESRKKTLWWHLGVIMMPLAVAVIIMTRTRGAMLGLGVGLVVAGLWYAKKRFGKKTILAFGSICIIGAAYAFSAGVIPSFMEGQRSDSIYTRLAMWQAGFNAFKEKPFIGWGGEHFILASSVHYNPEAARVQATWFDRAHNKIIDVVVAQGIVGGIIFLGLIGSVVWAVRKDRTYKKPLTLAFGSAYLVQAMFVPDEIISWIALMVFLGFLVGSGEIEEDGEKESAPHPGLVSKVAGTGFGILFIAMFYYGNILPYKELKILSEAKGADDPIPFMERAFAKNTFIQAEAEAYLIDFYMDNRPDLIMSDRAGSIIRDELRTTANKEPQDIQQGIRYVRLITEQAKFEQAKESGFLYRMAEEELLRIKDIAPKRQEVYYLLAQVLGLRGKTEEAVKIAERAVELYPGVARARYFLGLALMLANDSGSEERAIGELIQAEELNPSLDTLFTSDLNNLVAAYKKEKRWDRVTDIVLRKVDGVITWTRLDEEMYIIALFHLAKEKNKEVFVKVATYMKDEFPEKKEEARGLLNLAEQEKWNIIQSAFEIEE